MGLAIALPASAAEPVAHSIQLNGTIDPATERWLGKALDDAKDDDVTLAIIRLDTPGGLDSSMREMVKDIIAAPFPVVVYVSPDGARAASAGMFITQAADVAAMAPQTNIGSATPISLGGGDIGGVLGRKVKNDASAFARALAEGHGRNGDLAARMVRDAVNVTASQAEEDDFVDVVAPNQQALLNELDGFEVKGPKAQTLNTGGLRIEQRDMPFRYHVLQVLVNPTVAFLLLLAGLVGLAIEALTPGTAVPGVLGGICLVLGLIGGTLLPISLVGVVLLLGALALFAAEAKVGGHGGLGAAGVIALIAAGLLLFDTDSKAFEISLPAVLAAAVVLGGFLVFAATKTAAARGVPVRGGPEGLVGDLGTVRVPLDPLGQVFVEGALWRAQLAKGGRLDRGRRVRVDAVEGLTLTVSPAGEDEEA
ncbi:MAG TPA: nodulation protein NfeD [Thermoleophilaceae bacterium]